MKRIVIAGVVFVLAFAGAYLWRARSDAEERKARSGRVEIEVPEGKPLVMRDAKGAFEVAFTRASRTFEFGVAKGPDGLIVGEAGQVHGFVFRIEASPFKPDEAFQRATLEMKQRLGANVTTDQATTIAGHTARVNDYTFSRNGTPYTARRTQIDIPEHDIALIVDTFVRSDVGFVDMAWIEDVTADLVTIRIAPK